MAVRPALDTLRDLRDGRFLDELSTELNELTRQVRATDKAGQLQVTISIKPVEKGDASCVIVTDEIKVKPPKVRNPTLFYTTPESNLSRRDPRQPDMFLRDVSAPEEPETTDPEKEADTAS